jgi:hypothetical protein
LHPGMDRLMLVDDRHGMGQLLGRRRDWLTAPAKTMVVICGTPRGHGMRPAAMRIGR